jgi:CubicO group peptidase (beta-lactamase class C family)
MQTKINGNADPAFSRVQEVFESNFAENSEFQEIGASVVVFFEGEEVVNLYGGFADAESNTPWQQDTLTHVFSSTKAFPAIAMAQLVSEGKVKYDDRIAKYWPEFAQNGKENITIAQVLSHQSGVNAFEEPIEAKDFQNWDDVCDRLAKQTPAFIPGEVTAYHAVTYGHLIMEVVRRVTGLMPAEYLVKYISGPLNADISIGAVESEWSRISTLIPPPPPKAPPPFDPKVLKAISNPMIIPGVTTAMPEWRQSQVPAVNGHVSAQGLAKVWGAIGNGGKLNGVELLSRDAIEEMSKPLSGPDMMMGPGQWAAGVSRNRGNLGPADTTIGNFGFGGSFGLADLTLGIGAAYVPNKLYPSILQDPRAQALATAIIESAQKKRA